MDETGYEEVYYLSTRLYGSAVLSVLAGVFVCVATDIESYRDLAAGRVDPARVLTGVLATVIIVGIVFGFGAVRLWQRAKYERVVLTSEGITYWNRRRRGQFLAWDSLAGILWKTDWTGAMATKFVIYDQDPSDTLRRGIVLYPFDPRRARELRDRLIERGDLREQPRKHWWTAEVWAKGE